MNERNGQVVRLRDHVYKKLVRAVARVNKRGWRDLGAARQDRPTMSSIVDEALEQMSRRTRAR